MGDTDLDKKQIDALELLYKDSIENIRLYKQQQFTITNYAIALYVAVVALHHKFENFGCRHRMEKIRESFNERSKEAWKAYDKPDHTSCHHNMDVAIVLVSVLLLGACAVWWVIYR